MTATQQTTHLPAAPVTVVRRAAGTINRFHRELVHAFEALGRADIAPPRASRAPAVSKAPARSDITRAA